MHRVKDPFAAIAKGKGSEEKRPEEKGGILTLGCEVLSLGAFTEALEAVAGPQAD